MFNQEGFVERTETGELEAVITHRGKPSPEIGLPVKTQSQTVSYRTTNGEELSLVSCKMSLNEEFVSHTR